MTSQYLAGIREGRVLFTQLRRDGFTGAELRSLLTDNIASLERLRDRVAPLAGSRGATDCFDGELAFYRNQLSKIEEEGV